MTSGFQLPINVPLLSFQKSVYFPESQLRKVQFSPLFFINSFIQLLVNEVLSLLFYEHSIFSVNLWFQFLSSVVYISLYIFISLSYIKFILKYFMDIINKIILLISH